MGYCSATIPFDLALNLMFKYVPEQDRKVVLQEWFYYWKQEDWDCEPDSEYCELLVKYGIIEDPWGR